MFSTGLVKLACRFTLVGSAILFSAVAPADYILPGGERINDPTKPYHSPTYKVSRQSAAVNFKLSYILSAADRQYAIINGEKVTQGDLVDGAKVLKITSNSVVLSVKGKQNRLQLNSVSGIKRK